MRRSIAVTKPIENWKSKGKAPEKRDWNASTLVDWQRKSMNPYANWESSVASASMMSPKSYKTRSVS